MNYIKGTKDLIATRKKTLVETLQSLRANQYSDDQELSNNVDIKHDKRQKKSSKRQLNARMDKIIENFLFI